MRIVMIVPGFGGTFYCQNCMRNLDLVHSLRSLNHTAVLTSMYIPLSLNDVKIEAETPLFFGAVNVYLKEYVPAVKIPKWLEALFNAKPFLRWVSGLSTTTDPKGLEEMTISVMEGENGKHKSELSKMISWLKEEARPQVVHLSNALLIGIGVKIRRELDIPVYCTLQDEDSWVDKMKEPYASKAWKLIEKSSDVIDGFISVSQYYSDLVQKRTRVSSNKIHVIPIGVPLRKYKSKSPSFDPPTIGFLSRMCESLGLNILVEAFLLLKKIPELKDIKLKISGGMSKEDKPFLDTIKKRIKECGYSDDVYINANLYLEDVNGFFDSLTLLCVPAYQGEAFGLFLLESFACGIPVLQPDVGAYPEIIKQTGGGVVYHPNTPEKLADELAGLLQDPDKIKEMSKKGFLAMKEHYTIEKMTERLLKIYNSNI